MKGFYLEYRALLTSADFLEQALAGGKLADGKPASGAYEYTPSQESF